MIILRSKINKVITRFSNLVGDKSSSHDFISIAPFESYTHEIKILKEASSKEVISFIEMEKSRAGAHKIVLHDVVKEDDVRHIHLYIFDKNWVEQHCAKSLFLIPATWLVHQAMDLNGIAVIDNVFISKTSKGPLTISKSPVMSTPELFAEANGIASSNIHYESSSWKDWIEKGIKALDKYPLVGFFNPLIKFRLQSYDYRPSMLSVIVVLGVYLGLSSTFLSWKIDNVNADIQRLSPEVSDVVAATSNTEQAVSAVEDLQQLISSRRFYLPVWLALRPVYRSGAIVKTIRNTESGHVEVSLQAKSASELVSLIAKNKYVESIALKGEVRNYRGEERFTVAIELKQSTKNDA